MSVPPILLQSLISVPPGCSAPCPAVEAPRSSAKRLQVGLHYAGQIVTIEVDETAVRVYYQREHLINTVLRTSRKEVTRKAYGHTTNRKTG